MSPPKALALLATIWLSTAPAQLRAEERTFTMKNGRTIDAEIVDAEPGMVNLLINGSKNWVKTSDYSKADRDFIDNWMRKNRGFYEWPNERGYAFDGSTSESLGSLEPKVLWRTKVGEGDAAVVANASNAFTTGIRDGRFVLVRLKIADGSEAWQASYSAKPGDGRATATPTIVGNVGQVISLGPAGRLNVWKVTDGSNLWAANLSVGYPGSKLPVGGMFGSPVAWDDLVYVEVGGPSTSLVSFVTARGLEKWKIGKHRSLGASPVATTISRREVIISRNEYGVVGRDVTSGALAWNHSWEGGGRAAPLPIDDRRVLAISDQGSAIFEIERDRAAMLWSEPSLRSTHVTPVFYQEFLYGFDGDDLACISANSGEVVWSQPGIGAGNLIRAGKHLLVQTGQSGELIIADADPAGYKERSRTKVFEGASRTSPSLVNGRLFCRSASGELVCLDVSAKK